MNHHDFKNFFDLSNDLLLISDFEGYLVEVNRRWLSVTGYSTEELRNKPLLDFIHPDDIEQSREGITGIGSYPKNEATHFENRLLSKDGNHIWLEWNSVVDQESQLVYSIARDITAFKKESGKEQIFNKAILKYSKLSLLENFDIIDFANALLKDILEIFSVESASYWLLSSDQEKIECSASAEMSGNESRFGKSIQKSEAPNYFNGILSNKIIAANDAKTNKFTFEFAKDYLDNFGIKSMLDAQVVGKSGLWGIICLECRKLRQWSFDEQNRLLSLASLLSVAFLNNERRKSNEELKRLSYIIDNVSEGVVITDSQRNVSWVNKGFTTMTGYEVEEVKGKNLGPLLQGPETSHKHVENIRRGLIDRKRFLQEIVNYGKDGRLTWKELSIAPIFSQDGGLQGYFGLQKDITRRKVAEEESAKIDRYFRDFHKLATKTNVDIGYFLTRYTELGQEIFGLNEGIVSKVDGSTFQILAISGSKESTLKVGQVVAAKEAFCELVIKKSRTIISNDLENHHELKRYISNKCKGVKAYMGAPIIVNDRIFGTLSFTSDQKRRSDFRQYEIELIELMASDLAKRLETDWAQQKLNDSINRIENIANGVPGAILQVKLTPLNQAEFIYASSQSQKVWDISKEEALKDLNIIWSKIHPDDIPELKSSIILSSKNLSFWEFTFRSSEKCGKTKWLNARGVPKKEPDGSVIWDTIILDVTKLKQTESELKKALQQKNVLFRELHHRIKNNLNMVNNLLYLRGRITENKEVLDSIKETQNRILTIAKTHDFLLRLEEFDRLYTKEYIEDLLQSLVSMYTTKPDLYNLIFDIENHKLHVDKLVTLGLLIYEIITNIFKHAYLPDVGGDIFLSLVKKQEAIIMKISDHGRGLNKDEGQQGTSLGMSLIATFVDQLEGSLAVNNNPGVQYLIKFPME